MAYRGQKAAIKVLVNSGGLLKILLSSAKQQKINRAMKWFITGL